MLRQTLVIAPLLGLLACHPSDSTKHQDAGESAGDGDTSSELDAGTPGSNNDSDEKLGADTKAKVASCKFTVTDSDGEIQDDYDRCAAHCVLSATCEEIMALLCDENINGGFGKCIIACPEAPKDGFDCGGGELVPHNAVCDLSADCANGADEKNCSTYTCKDGEKIPANDIVCNGSKDCTDGSDEAGCSDPCTK